MQHKSSAFLVLLSLLVFCLVIPAAAASWPAESDLSMSCWSQDDENITEDLGMYPDLSTMDSGLYMSPTLFIQNSTSSSKTFSMYWVMDGDPDKVVDFDDITINAGKQSILALSSSTANSYATNGVHSVEVVINDSSVYTFFYIVSGNGSSSSKTTNTSKGNASSSSNNSSTSSSRNTLPTFNKSGLQAKNLTVSGLVWRTKASTSYATNKYLTASTANGILAGGGEVAFNYKMTAKGLTDRVSFSTKLVIVAPDGYEGTINFGTVTYQNNGYLWCETTGDSFFTGYYHDKGKIASGKYQLFLYLDDELANYSTLNLD